MAERGIGTAGAGLLLFMHRPFRAALAKRLVAKQFNEKLADEGAANRGLFLLVEAAITDGGRPVVQDFLVRVRRRLGRQALFQQGLVEQRVVEEVFGHVVRQLVLARCRQAMALNGRNIGDGSGVLSPTSSVKPSFW